MLKILRVKNIALISELELELRSGLNVLSGETGAGKSIIIDSLAFLLGERADKSLIRYGESFAQVEGIFEVSKENQAVNVLMEMNVEFDGEIIIKRKMMQDGKSDIRINGSPVTLGMLKSVTESLCDIYGQHEHQSLLKTSSHVKLLDKFGGEEIEVKKRDFSVCYERYLKLKEFLENSGSESERERQADILRYQIEEITSANLEIGEDVKLDEIRKKLQHTEKIVSDISNANGYLTQAGDGGAELLINLARRELSSALRYDESLTPLYERLESIEIELKDVASSLVDSLSDYEFSPARAQEIEARHEQIKLLKRKYGGSVEEILSYCSRAENELEELLNAKARIDTAETEMEKIKGDLFDCAVALSSKRRATALEFESIITSELSDLGMSGTTFKIDFSPVPDKSCFENSLNSDGIDSISFMISPNKGEPLKPLSKIVSGGEMSRFMLACKKIIATLDGIETLVFDEVDTGISGRIAQIVSEKLYNISVLSGQIIAVTHLPQLSAMSDTHYLIEKFESNGKTLTSLKMLTEEEKEIEVARLAGAENNEHSLHHAREIIDYATKFKNSVRKP